MDPEAMSEQPHAIGALLRESGPAHKIVAPDGSAAWLVTRYEDVALLLADPRLSLSKQNAKPDGGYRGFELPPALDANLLNMDPPQHTRLRRLAGPAFGSRHVAQMRPALEKAAHRLADDMAAAGDVDLVTDFATPFSVLVISELLGVPEESRHRFRAWTTGLLGTGATREGMREIVGEMLRFFTGLIADKRTAPGTDVLSALVAARDADDDRLTEDELTSLAFLLLFAGFENSANLMASCLHAVLADPELRRSVHPTGATAASPDATAALVEEVARHESPALLAIRRFPVEDIDVGGVTVPAGETVLLSLASANRDPRRFAAPDAVDPARPDLARHLSFGQGIHYCIGAPLARLEAQIALGVFLDRFPNARLDPGTPPRWQPSPRVRGLASLRARVDGR